MPTDQQLAKVRNELEIENLRLEMKLKDVEIRLKEFEIRQRPGFWKTVLVSPLLIAALVTAYATVFATMLSARNAQAEREGTMIIESIKARDTAQAAANLRFLVETGLVENRRLAEHVRRRDIPSEGRLLPPSE